MHRTLAGPAALLALALLAGCGSDDGKQSAQPTPSATSAPTDRDSMACRTLFTDTAAQVLARAEPRPPVATRVGELDACRWDLTTGEWIQLVDVPAAAWAEQLPALLDEVEDSALDAETRAKFAEGRELIRTGDLTDAQACAMFSTMAEKLQGAPKASDTFVAFLPAPPKPPQAVNAQRCVGGRYTSVMLVDAGLVGNAEELRRAGQALAAVRS